ncbi:hypothetical protein [Kutzneria buriramensis]|uniref:Uncharacterized protein n=1 Tax=Kutzneria buriramensis TaxID=1045776 RepID=A0A3E0G5W5_9PSEU|nr:hypothetical protein [Kutzneria buriramensis]REH17451.1 hypothetical protein BCF44_1467 [Kutzneria buriramensis]
MNRAKNRTVTFFVQQREFGVDAGFIAQRPMIPIACAAARTVAVGIAAAFAAGAALVAANHYFGHQGRTEVLVDGQHVADTSVSDLVDVRLLAFMD